MDNRQIEEAVDVALEAFMNPSAWSSDRHPRDDAGRFAKGTGLSPETIAGLRARARARKARSDASRAAKGKSENNRLKRARIHSMVRAQFEDALPDRTEG